MMLYRKPLIRWHETFQPDHIRRYEVIDGSYWDCRMPRDALRSHDLTDLKNNLEIWQIVICKNNRERKTKKTNTYHRFATTSLWYIALLGKLHFDSVGHKKSVLFFFILIFCRIYMQMKLLYQQLINKIRISSVLRYPRWSGKYYVIFIVFAPTPDGGKLIYCYKFSSVNTVCVWPPSFIETASQ